MDQINNNHHIELTNDNYIISLSKDIFKLSRFKELLIRETREKLLLQFTNEQPKSQSTVIQVFRQVNIAEESMDISQIAFEFLKECKLLNPDHQTWQSGKIKAKISLSLISKNMDEVILEFYPNEWDSESTLKTEDQITPLMTSIQVSEEWRVN